MKFNRWLMAAAAGMAALVVSGSFDTADARSRGAGARGFHGAGHARAFSGRAFHGHVHGGRVLFGAPGRDALIPDRRPPT